METALVVAGVVALLVIAAIVNKSKKQKTPPLVVPLPTPAEPTERGAALFGDSLTQAFGQQLGDYPLPVENHAIAGTSSTDAINKHGILQKIASTPMDTVVIRYGVVDAMRGEVSRLQYNLLNMVAAAGKRRVFLVGGINIPMQIAAYPQVDTTMQMVASATGARYVDLRHVPIGDTPDTLHPAPAHGQVHAQVIAAAIK